MRFIPGLHPRLINLGGRPLLPAQMSVKALLTRFCSRRRGRCSAVVVVVVVRRRRWSSAPTRRVGAIRQAVAAGHQARPRRPADERRAAAGQRRDMHGGTSARLSARAGER